MTTNTNPSRSAALRFFASSTANADGRFTILERPSEGGPATVIAEVKGRAAARAHATALSLIDPTDEQGARVASDASKAARTSHADCAHVSTKLARAICRRDRAAATAVGDQVEASTPR